jgi:hypothetical protein
MKPLRLAVDLGISPKLLLDLVQDFIVGQARGRGVMKKKTSN